MAVNFLSQIGVGPQADMNIRFLILLALVAWAQVAQGQKKAPGKAKGDDAVLAEDEEDSAASGDNETAGGDDEEASAEDETEGGDDEEASAEDETADSEGSGGDEPKAPEEAAESGDDDAGASAEEPSSLDGDAEDSSSGADDPNDDIGHIGPVGKRFLASYAYLARQHCCFKHYLKSDTILTCLLANNKIYDSRFENINISRLDLTS